MQATMTQQTQAVKEKKRLDHKVGPAMLLMPFMIVFFLFQIAPMLWVLIPAQCYWQCKVDESELLLRSLASQRSSLAHTDTQNHTKVPNRGMPQEKRRLSIDVVSVRARVFVVLDLLKKCSNMRIRWENLVRKS